MMTDARDDLTPKDGLCDVFLEFDGLQTRPNSPHGDITFRFVHRTEGYEKVLATMSFPVNSAHDGFPGMMARAHDQLIAVLRQSLYLAGKRRSHYKHEAQTHYPTHYR
jgi:hypothetical protein